MATLIIRHAPLSCCESQIQDIFLIIFQERVIDTILIHEVFPFKTVIIHLLPLDNIILSLFIQHISIHSYKLVMFQQGSFWKVSLCDKDPIKNIGFWYGTSRKKTRIPYKIEPFYL